MKIKNLINYLGQLKVNVNSDFMSEPIEEVIEQLERFEEFKKEIVWCEEDTKYGHPVYNRTTIGYLYEQKYFPKPTKKTITIEIEGENEDIEKFTDGLNLVVGQINVGVRTNIKEVTK